MLLPGILTFEGIPHSLRVIGVIPVVYIFIALATEKIYQFLASNTKTKPLLIFACLFLLFAISFSEFNKYFVKWGKNPEVKGAFTKRFYEIGEYLNSLPEDTQKYVIVNELGVPVPYPDGIPMPAQTVMFVQTASAKGQETSYILPEDLEKIKINKRTVIVPMRYDERLFFELRERFPQSEFQEKKEVWIFKIM